MALGSFLGIYSYFVVQKLSSLNFRDYAFLVGLFFGYKGVHAGQCRLPQKYGLVVHLIIICT